MSMTRAEAIDWFEQVRDIAKRNLGEKWTRGCEKHYQLKVDLAEAALIALRGPTRETVERMFPGCDICHEAPLENVGLNEEEIYVVDGKEVPANESLRYCPRCGKPLTDEAVDMMLERWKEAVSNENS